MEKILYIVLLVVLFYIYDQGLFRIIEIHYCKKNKGRCETCKCWSCEKAIQDEKRKKERL